MWTLGIVHEARGVKGSGRFRNVEFLEKISAKIRAFSTLCVKDWPSLVKCGIDDVSAFFTFFTKYQKFLKSLL